jgi:hypothetical protein
MIYRGIKKILFLLGMLWFLISAIHVGTIAAATIDRFENSSAYNRPDCITAAEDPGSIRGSLHVIKSGNNILFNWTSCICCCVFESHALYAGTLPFSGYNHIPISCQITSTSYSMLDDGQSHYFLVTVRALGFEGSYGLNSAGAERPPSTTPCDPQLIGCHDTY